MERLEQINSWLASLWPGRRFALAAASADASFRRYYRATLDDGTTRIVMDAPDENRQVLAQFMAAAGSFDPSAGSGRRLVLPPQ